MGGHVFFSGKSVTADRIGAMRRVVADHYTDRVRLYPDRGRTYPHRGRPSR